VFLRWLAALMPNAGSCVTFAASFHRRIETSIGHRTSGPSRALSSRPDWASTALLSHPAASIARQIVLTQAPRVVLFDRNSELGSSARRCSRIVFPAVCRIMWARRGASVAWLCLTDTLRNSRPGSAVQQAIPSGVPSVYGPRLRRTHARHCAVCIGAPWIPGWRRTIETHLTSGATDALELPYAVDQSERLLLLKIRPKL
jgi:hypothetical protein